MSTIDQAIAKMKSEMQAAGASQNPYYLAQLAAQDAAKTTGESLDELLNQAYTRLGLPSTTTSSAAKVASQADTSDIYPSGDPGGGGSGSKGGREGGMAGQMSAADRATLGTIADITSLLGGIGVPGLGVISGAVKGALGIDSALTALGLAEAPDLVGLSSADFSEIGALHGAYAESAARAAQTSDLSSFADANKSVGMRGLSENQLDAAREAAALGKDPGPETPSSDMKDGSVTGNPTGSPTDTQSGANGPGPGDGTDTGGHGTAGDGSMNARGGVRRATKPTKAIFGEAGPETAVFVPDQMRFGGKQPNEDAVIAALETLLAELKGKR